VDIENLIAESRSLVIEGRAGSGKTTLAKHFTCMIIEKRELKGLDGYLPVLVFLKDLKDFKVAGLTGNSETAEKLLAYWGKNSFLDVETIRVFCEAGKIVFLLDGLDEIDESLRELIVTSFNGLKIKHENCKIILSGRPHGVDDIVKKWFERPVEILPLLMTQVEEFIHKWFQFIYESERSGFKKTAQDMIGEIKSHPSIGELIDSPLMLTAICLLYSNNKELPGQRADLYDRFVTNLLYKRFRAEAQKVRNFLMHLARSMHQEHSKTIGRLEAVRILGNEYKQEAGESQKEYNDRLNERFELVEPGCGLLKKEKGGYGFIHLTFQEFLTANALVAGTTESYFETIRQYWGDDWYREVVQLYIGYLSIQSPAMANSIIQTYLKVTNDNLFSLRRLAVRSFLGIHRSNRKDSVTLSSINCMLEIIDSSLEPEIKVEAGELLGRIGDSRDLEKFIPIPDGKYKTSIGKVVLKNFEMAKYLVTNGWYRKFIDDNGYKTTGFWSQEGQKWLESEKNEHPYYWFDHEWNCPNAPVVGVSWYEAHAFTQWLNQTRNDGYHYFLPDENQWEAVAAGMEKREYPWGNGWQEGCCNSRESQILKATSVGIFANGDTPEGISDFAGNVWEWTRSDFSSKKTLNDPQYYPEQDFNDRQRLELRGGSWDEGRLLARCAFRRRGLPSLRNNDMGLRCARTK
ncbi:MAG: SUMF1/EgtB/PvdO family nonheme iron enzyme, partial [Bacteroidia bacterium]|nr:SUMF1/EgtB/PvdO family nonheme iron enzyme [Bacteroidia bacterium]